MKLLKNIIIALSFIIFQGCGKLGPRISDATIKISRISDNFEVFHSQSVEAAIVDDMGGLVLVVNDSDKNLMEIATSTDENSGQEVSISIGGYHLKNSRIIAGFSGFLYFRGSYRSVVDDLKRMGVKMYLVKELPISSGGVNSIMGR